MTRLFIAAVVWMVLALPMAVTASVVWFSTDEHLFRADTTTNAIVQTLPIKGIASLAVDSQRAVWIVTTKQVSKFAADGSPLFQADLSMIGLMAAPIIAVNPYDNSVWLVDQKTALRLDANGRPLFSIPAPGANARQIQIAPDESLWILGNKQLTHYSPSGAMIENFDLHAITTAEPKYFVVDKIGGSIWFAGEKELIQVDLVSAQHVLRRIALAEPVLGLVTQSTTGAIWVLGQDRLVMVDVTGTIGRNIDLKGQAFTGVDTLVFDAVADCAWVTHKTGVARFSASTGQLLARIVTPKSAEEVGVAPFTVLPQLSLIQPHNGMLTNNPLPTFALQYGALCNGQPCGFTNTYLSTYVLSATINSQLVGNLFGFELATGKAAFTPVSRLPEGINTFAAQVRDRFGHFSDTVNSTFTVDTVPPKFMGLAPADGSVVFTPQVRVTGGIDEPGQVLVENFSDFLGIGANPAGINFSFGLTLNPGLNSIRLRANDVAGNITNKTIRLNYVPEISVIVDSPLDGAVINGNSVILSGTFQGPSNLGITVNGIVAAMDGNRFFANVPLQSGSNPITVIGSAPGLANVTKTVAVIASTSAIQVSAFPQNGIAPHPVSFSVFSGASNGVARIDVDFNGDGITDFTTTDPDAPIQTTYTTPGVYKPRVTVTDSQGVPSTSTLVVVVTTVGKIDAVLRSVYGGMLAKLKVGDVDGALAAFTPSAVQRYRPVFEELLPNLATITDQFGTIADGTVSNGFAEYVLVQDVPTGRQAFLMYFIRSGDGVWRINQM